MNIIICESHASFTPAKIDVRVLELHFLHILGLKNAFTTYFYFDLHGATYKHEHDISSLHFYSTTRHAAWVGGSMFASFSTFQNFVMSKAEYEEAKNSSDAAGALRALVSRKSY